VWQVACVIHFRCASSRVGGSEFAITSFRVSKRLRVLSEHQLGSLTADLTTKIAVADVMAMPIPPVPPSGLPSQLMDARPDIRQAEQQLVAANANIGVAKAALYPSVSLTGAYGGESLELSDITKSLARIWTLGLDVSLPIFNGGG
jgi:outer membrane protein, multidrug efflux system